MREEEFVERKKQKRKGDVTDINRKNGWKESTEIRRKRNVYSLTSRHQLGDWLGASV